MVQVHLGPPSKKGGECGGVAQLGERLPCTQEVIGSTPFTSTRLKVLVVALLGIEGVT